VALNIVLEYFQVFACLSKLGDFRGDKFIVFGLAHVVVDVEVAVVEVRLEVDVDLLTL
jgi:hypothetical protein